MKTLAGPRLALLLVSGISVAGSIGHAESILEPPPILLEMSGTISQADFLKGLSGALPKGLSALNQYGLDKQIEAKITDLAPKIYNDLGYAGDGGALIEVKLQSFPTEIGKFPKFIGDGVEYVGIGATPAEAELAKISRHDRLSQAPDKDWSLDSDRSLVFWAKKTSSGIKLYQMPFSSLVRETLLVYSKRTLEKYQWQAAKSAELERLVKIASEKLPIQAVEQIAELAKSRHEALQRQERINEQLKLELDRARQAAQNAAQLEAFGSVLKIGAAIATASEGLPSADAKTLGTETTVGGLGLRLHSIKSEADTEATQLNEALGRNNVLIWSTETNLMNDLQNKGVPVGNVPSGEAPTILKP